jgi:hypothetical protein
MEGKLDQKSGMKDVEIGRRWFNWVRTVPALRSLDRASRQINLNRRGYRQVNLEIDGFLVVEGNLLALALRVLRRRRFRFAVTVGRAAAFRARHEILIARDATTPNKGSEEQQSQKRVCQGSTHGSASQYTNSSAGRRSGGSA